MSKKEMEKERRARRLSEMQRMARQAIQDQLEARRIEKERRKLELLKVGDLSGLENLQNESEDTTTDIVVPEELSDEEVESKYEVENENEYFPPPGLLIPGFYAPPNDIAKVNGLAVLFPKIVAEYVTPGEEFLQPHVLVLLDVTKANKALKALAKYRSSLLHMGIFIAPSPYCSKHIAYSMKQFQRMNLVCKSEDLKLAFMVSMERDLALLELMDLNPYHVSRDCVIGEEECAAMFPVDYGDGVDEFEDFDELDEFRQ